MTGESESHFTIFILAFYSVEIRPFNHKVWSKFDSSLMYNVTCNYSDNKPDLESENYSLEILLKIVRIIISGNVSEMQVYEQ